MPWLITTVAAWVILILLIDLKQLKYTFWSGLFALLCQLIIDNMAVHLHLYEFKFTIAKNIHSALFFTVGAPFAIGILFAQTYPKNRLMRLIDIIVSTVLFFIMEYALNFLGALRYIHWDYLYSIPIDILALMSMGNLITIFKLAPWMRKGNA